MVNYQNRVFLDYGTGNHSKGLWLCDIELSDSEKECLIGFHVFTGNDYISSFFRKGKRACWKIIEKNPKFIEVFALLSSSWSPQDEVYDGLGEYVCRLYGYKKKDVNYVRHQLFECTYSGEDKIIDLSLLPPCRSSLRLHSFRATAVAKIWNDTDQRTVHLPDLTLHGWNEDFRIRWFDDAFPQNVIDILMDPNFDMIDDDIYGADQESDKEE